MILRPPEPAELRHLSATLDHYGCPQDVVERQNLVIREGRYREVFSASPLIRELAYDVDSVPVALGMKIGELVKGAFRPSLEFGTVLFPLSTKNAVSLAHEHAMRFLYGRDIFREHLDPGMELGRKVVGMENAGFLGFGIYNGRTLANVIDKGAYLRQFQ